MSISIHMRAVSIKKMGGGIAHHIARNSKTAQAAADESSSLIRPNLTQFNVPVFGGYQQIEQAKDLIAKRIADRQKAGLKKWRPDTGVAAISTVQLSFGSLKKLGWKVKETVDENGVKTTKSLPADQQTDKAISFVTQAYQLAYKSLKKQPETFGAILVAGIHFDESTPHMDVATLNIGQNLDSSKTKAVGDGSEIQLDTRTRTYTNGNNDRQKHYQATRDMQDRLENGLGLTDKQRDMYEFRRGTTVKDSKRNVKVKAKNLREKETALNELTDKLHSRSKGLHTRSKHLKEQEERLFERSDQLDKREAELKAREQQASQAQITANKQIQEAEKEKQKYQKQQHLVFGTVGILANAVDSRKRGPKFFESYYANRFDPQTGKIKLTTRAKFPGELIEQYSKSITEQQAKAVKPAIKRVVQETEPESEDDGFEL